MSATTFTSKNTSAGQRLADWSVIVITIAALLAGWLLMNSVESRGVPFDASGISAQTPQGWLKSSVQGNEVLYVSDPFSSGFGTTYIVQKISGPIDIVNDAPVAQDATVDQVVSLLTLQYGQSLNSFRVLEKKLVTVNGQEAYEISYVFVESNPDLTHSEIPNIVRGLDYIFLKGDHAIVATYRADEKSFDSDMGRFQRFLTGLKF